MNEILLTSAVLILVILLARWLFRGRVSQRLIYSAWLLVAVRLLVPVQLFDFQFSILQTAEPVTQVITQISTTPVAGPSRDQVFDQIVQDYIEKDTTVFVPEVQEQIKVEISQGTQSPSEIFDKIQQQRPKEEFLIPEVQQQVAQQVEESITMPTVGQIALAVWIAGMALMALWFLFVNLRHGYGLRKDAQPMECSESPVPVRISSKVDSPCLVGFFRPVVYLTPASAESPQTLKHVLAHELTHLRHGDHIWSLVRCICLCIYWFNPLVWLAAYLSRRDCELACDEGALKRLGEQERIAYGKTLLEVVSHASSPTQLLQTATSMNETRKQLTERVNFIVKKPKFIITAAICMVLICTIAVGCAFAGPTSNPSVGPTDPTTIPPSSVDGFLIPENGYDGGEVTIRFDHTWSTQKQQELLGACIEEFNKLYPNIHIYSEFVGDEEDLVPGIVYTDNKPNIAMCFGDQIAIYNRRGLIVPLDTLIGSQILVTRADGTTEILGLSQEQLADLIPAFYEDGRSCGDGKMYTMPLFRKANIMYYNKTFFEENELKVPETWEEMWQVCEQIRQIDGEYAPLMNDDPADLFVLLSQQYGTELFNSEGECLFNNEINREFAAEFVAQSQAGNVSLNSGFPLYLDERYMIISDCLAANYFCADYGEYEVGVAPVPQANVNDPKAFFSGMNLCIIDNEDPQKVIASWLFVKFMSTNMAYQQAVSMSGGYVPVIRSAIEDETYQAWINSGNGYDALQGYATKCAIEQIDGCFRLPIIDVSGRVIGRIGKIWGSHLYDAESDLAEQIQEEFEKAVEDCESYVKNSKENIDYALMPDL